MNKVEAGGLQLPNTGGSIFGGPIPESQPTMIQEARLARIAELEAERSDLVEKYRQQSDTLAAVAQKATELQVENAKLRSELAAAIAGATVQPK